MKRKEDNKMYSHYFQYTLENEVRNRHFNFIAEVAHQRLVEELKQARQGEVSLTRSPRQLLGQTIIKIGGWLTVNPHLKEA